MGSRIKALACDFDKTIANTGNYTKEKIGEIYKFAGREIKIDDKELEVGSRWPEILKMLHVPRRKATQIYLSNIDAITLYDRVKETFEYVHSLGYPIGIATHSPRCVVETVFERNGVLGYITKMVTFDEILKLKLRPKPAPIAFYGLLTS